MNTNPSSTPETATKSSHQPLSQETIRGLQELGEVFRQIHKRLVSEGYVIRDGKITKPGSNENDNGKE